MENRLIASVLGCLIILLLSSCASTPRTIEISANPVEKPQLSLPSADVLHLREVKWVIVTEENIEEVFAELARTGRPIVLFGLTDKGYSNLGLNFSDIRAYIEQQKAIIAAYEGYYKSAEEALENANSQADSVNKKVDKHNKQPKESFLDKLITPFKK
tara:strand:+ start:641 stop:1114 length:474 start_codon:yes stop_codon:yes gene_type:complete